jgi:hypothetical protein
MYAGARYKTIAALGARKLVKHFEVPAGEK